MSQQFDLVITDQTMPNMTGEMLVPEIRRIRPDIPVILCTGFSHTMNAAKARSMGIDAFLMKPLVIRDVAVTIQQVLAGQEALPKTQPGGRILLIDDDDQLRFMLRQVLETAGYEVIDASNGRQGIQRFKETPADLVITDLIMPEQRDWRRFKSCDVTFLIQRSLLYQEVHGKGHWISFRLLKN